MSSPLFVFVCIALLVLSNEVGAKRKTRLDGQQAGAAEPSSQSSGHGSVNHVVCNITGPCTPCTQPEKDEDWSVCRSTGYRQPITCLLLPQEESTRLATEVVEAPVTKIEASATEVESSGAELAEVPARRRKRKRFLGRKLFGDQHDFPAHDSEFDLEDDPSPSDDAPYGRDRIGDLTKEIGDDYEADHIDDVLVPASFLNKVGKSAKDKSHFQKIAALIPAHW
eukprot:CAMPEP_0196580316 /NCGR_PEP_ID=MMETSP1081-20130531/28495_1 /TAXON_ID=36882 /ORGANISM="Pyramimonas amylifera, Strain CCMP720" /LENGTH=223 /DNA_ID=CAMNT_0041900155 /DNA_START=82 /DNA_END=750 /DNA_ORIENTATION=-